MRVNGQLASAYSMSYTRKLRSRTIESAKEEIVKVVTNVVENALKMPTSPTPGNSSDDSRLGRSSCKLAACQFFLVLFACYAEKKVQLCRRHSVFKM